MIITSDGAKKLLEKLGQDKDILLQRINDDSTFVAAVTEDIESCRPEFDLKENVRGIFEIDKKIVKLRHAKNEFNNKEKLSNGLTLGEGLVQLAILNRELGKFKDLSVKQKKVRNPYPTTKEIEYVYTNYDTAYAKEVYHYIQGEISRIQQEINLINATKTFEVDLD